VVDVSAFVLPPPARPRGSWPGAIGWFFAGAASLVLLGVTAAGLAAAHAGEVSMLVLGGGACAMVWGSTKLPGRHGAAYVVGAAVTVLAVGSVFVYELMTTPWGL
jgi:hypothetical protein